MKSNKIVAENGIIYLNVVAGNFLFRNIRHIVKKNGSLRIIDDDFEMIKNLKNARVPLFGSIRQVVIEGKLKGVVERKVINVKGPSLNEYYILGKTKPHINDLRSSPFQVIKSNPLNDLPDKENTRKSRKQQEQSIQPKLSENHKTNVDSNLNQQIPDNSSQLNLSSLNIGSFSPVKRDHKITVTQRNQILAQQLKALYNDYCQICGTRIDLGDGESMSEVHHIQPLGAHNGPDIPENMVVVCPNCHTLFDRGAITIDLQRNCIIHINPKHPLHEKVLISKHKINSKYIEYHNTNIFRNRSVRLQNQSSLV